MASDNPHDWPRIEYCEEVVEKGGGIQPCDAPLDSSGRCAHGRNHIDD